jgi:putative ABC transport system permease protein
MRALNRKLLRELWRNAGSLALVILIIGIGVACFIGLGTAIRVLSSSQAEYYREYRFADFWVELKKAPLTAVQQLARLPGVDRVEGRIVFDVILDVPGEAQPLTGRLISVPPQRLDQVLNGLCLVRGSTFSDDRDEEVILSESFAREHGLGPGDRIGLIVNRKQESFIIAGTAISPEYVYMIRGEGDFLPDPRHFGILYVKEDFARDVLDFQDACNQIVGRFVPGAAEEFVLRRIERELDPYGVYAATPRERQASHRVLTDEIVQQKNASTLIPAIFLAVAALVLNVLMSRLAERQRTVIGTLKALGYYNRTVLWHFVSFGLAVGLVGGVIGDLLGIWVAHGMVRLYAAIFQFPQFDFRIHADLLAAGLLISVAFSAAGTLRGVWNVLRLHPAEAMRERPPEHGGAIFLERWPWLWRRLGFRTHMALRGLLRHPVRTLTGMLSTGLATGIMFLSLTLLGSIWFLIDYQLEYVLTSDVDIAMRDPQSVAALLEARQLPGVDYAEPLLGVTADLRNGRYSRRLGVLGLSPGHRLTTPMQRDRTPVEIPADGIVMTAKLAEILELRVGDRFELTPVRGRRETVHARLAGVVDSYLGLDCYADQAYLSRIVGEPLAVSSVQMRVDPARQAELYRAIKQLPNAQGLSVRANNKAIVEETLIDVIARVHSVLIFFAGVIAFGSILNSAMVELGDRIREVSTLRVLGYTPGEVAAIFYRQTAVVFCCGLLLGFPIGYALVQLVVANMPTELVRLPITIRPATFAIGIALPATFVLAAQAVIYRRLRRLDWLEGIKVKE